MFNSGFEIYPNPFEDYYIVTELIPGDDIRILNLIGIELCNVKNRHDISKIVLNN
jgi:hypothetical protein